MYDDASKTALAVRLTVTQIVAAYEQACRDIRSAFALLADVEERMSLALSSQGTDRTRVLARAHHTGDWDSPEHAIKDLRLSVWCSLVERLEIRRFLSVARAAELDRMLEGKSDDDFPEITIENVLGFAKGFEAQASDMLREAIEEVFSWLRPRGSEYKRNSELEVPPRIILRWMVETAWSGSGFRVHYGRAQSELTALQNVFSSLDGQGTIAKTHYGALYDAICASPDGRGETEYFRFRCFKNRNLHLEFKRLDLLARFNALAGGARLRPAS